jgi:hypothetical protein
VSVFLPKTCSKLIHTLAMMLMPFPCWFLLTWKVVCTQFYNLSSQLILCACLQLLFNVHRQVKKQHVTHIVESSYLLLWYTFTPNITVFNATLSTSVFTLVLHVSTTLGHHQVLLLLLLQMFHCNFAFISFVFIYAHLFICLILCLTFYFQH